MSAEIDLDTAQLLKDLWQSMLLDTKYPPKYMVGHDGETSHFSMFIWGRGDVTGQTWSPKDSTKAGTLVKIGKLMADYAKAKPEERHSILDEIKFKANELKTRLDAEKQAEAPAR